MERRLVGFTAVLGLLVFVTTVAAPQGMATQKLAGPLRLLNWQGYGSDEKWAIEAFKKKFSVDIVHDYFNSEEELLTKLRTSPGTYDAVLPNSAYYLPAIKEGLIEPIDVNKISNYKDVSDRLRKMPELNQDGKVYGVPWTWGATAMAYNTKAIPQGIDSIQAYWDPRFKGKVGWWDDFLNSVQFAAIALGQDPNAPSDLKAVQRKLMALKGQIRTLWTSEDQFNKLFAANNFVLAVYWSGSTARARKVYKLPIAFVIPREGAIGWVDAWAIPKNAPHREAALAWINYMISPEFYVPWDTNVGAPAPSNDKSLKALPTDAFNRRVMGDPVVLKRLIFMKTISEEQRKEFIKVWEAVKASLAR